MMAALRDAVTADHHPAPVGETSAPQAALRAMLRCPLDGAALSWRGGASTCPHGHDFSAVDGIPCLSVADDAAPGTLGITETVRAFYDGAPSPDYDGLDTRDALRARVGVGAFERMLDAQLPVEARVLDIGCGTGQLTNFLGLRYGRTVIGADLCLAPLRLAQGFRERFSVNNTHFVQGDLFRPPFAPEAFDVVIAHRVLGHTGDPPGAFRAIAPLVKPGGAVILGLYNRLGRLPHLVRRALTPQATRGEPGRERYGPHESRHSLDEALGWLEAAGFDFTASIPTVGDRQFSAKAPLFEPQSAGTRWARLSSEIDMMMTGAQGGVFTLIGKKRR